MTRSLFIPCLVVVMACAIGTTAMAQQPPPHAILLNGNAMTPARPLAAGIGATVQLETSTGMVTLSRGTIALKVTPYDARFALNDQPAKFPVPPMQRAGQLYLPVRAVTVAFGAAVALQRGTAQDSSQRVIVTYQGTPTAFRIVEAGRVLTTDIVDGAEAENAFAVANVPCIDAYNSPYLSDIVPLEMWVVQGTRTLWRGTIAKGVSVSRFTASDVTGDRTPELQLTYFTRHSYMGPYPGSIYTAIVFHWSGRAPGRVLTLEYSRDHGHLYLEPATPDQAATFILVDTNWKRNEDSSHYIAELYAWNGQRFRLTERKITRQPIASEAAARRLLDSID